jgi:hypothetical protein
MESTASPAAREAGLVFAQVAKYHPKKPHWSLPLIGVGTRRIKAEAMGCADA